MSLHMGHRQLVGRLIAVRRYNGVGADLVCDYAASRAPAISAQVTKAWERAARYSVAVMRLRGKWKRLAMGSWIETKR